MKQYPKILSLIVIMYTLMYFSASGQISPGDLASPHSKLEGISNCTQCHVLGSKVSSEKCLVCHTEIKERTSINKGYHSSSEIKGKECIACHSDHHGKNFQLLRFDIAKFDHNLTGYSLSTPHSKKACADCHNQKFISDQKIRSKKFTYMGVGTSCLNCHADYHQKTLSSECLTCHTPESFKPASKFNHADTKFHLAGKHASLECSGCHKVSITDGKKFQDFRVAQFNCSNCHKDPHQNKFGQNCSQCHNETSFTVISGVKGFDHNKTDFKLEEKHLNVNCKACHKTKFTDPLKFNLCTDCHTDYHKGQFAKNGVSTDCSKCHTVKGFNQFSFTLAQHNQGKFVLEGAHLAIPCTDCHQKQTQWTFRGIGINCKDCHKDIHQNSIESKFYPDQNCRVCHKVDNWHTITFDHSLTDFKLTGGHMKKDCISCHVSKAADGNSIATFRGLSKNCSSCHEDNHFGQFEKDGISDCSVCHDTQNWKASNFDHQKTKFPLDGKHINVECSKCHKAQKEGTNFYVRYKLKVFTCESCHS
jgi:hypothetical protein